MSEHLEDRRLDDQLADFTDRLLNHESGDNPQSFSQDEALEKLQKTIVRLEHASGEGNQPDSEFAARLRAVLLEEWRKMGTVHKAEPAKGARFLQILSEPFQYLFKVRHTPTLVLRFGMVAMGVLVLLLFILPINNGEITGSAGLGSIGWPVIAVLAILCIGIIWYFHRQNK